MEFGYVRVSTREQNEARQLEALRNLNIKFENILIDKASGKNTERAALKELLVKLREGDTVNILSMDRLSRDLIDMHKLVETMTNKGATVHFIDINQTFSANEKNYQAFLMLGLLGTIAQYERNNNKARQMAGIALAKERGVYKGRKPTIDRAEVAEMLKSGWTKAKIARALGISRSSLHRIERELAQSERDCTQN